jgi:hypothetical protein
MSVIFERTNFAFIRENNGQSVEGHVVLWILEVKCFKRYLTLAAALVLRLSGTSAYFDSGEPLVRFYCNRTSAH